MIDHHPPRPGSARAAWCDIRPDLGATSTIVFEYLRQRAVPIDAPLATAFFFALRTETRDLGRESTEAERRAYLALVPLVDHNLLYRMTHPKVPRAHFAALDRALRSALLFGDVVAVNLGALGYPDLVAEIADLLLSYEGARFVLCMGQYEDSPYLSLRTEADNARAGTVMRQVVGNDGAAGGHGTMAGARLFARVSSEAELAVTFQDMVQRLLAALGHSVDARRSAAEPAAADRRKDLERSRALASSRRALRARRPLDAAREPSAGRDAPGAPARSRARPPSTPERPRTRRTPEASSGGKPAPTQLRAAWRCRLCARRRRTTTRSRRNSGTAMETSWGLSTSGAPGVMAGLAVARSLQSSRKGVHAQNARPWSGHDARRHGAIAVIFRRVLRFLTRSRLTQR